MKRGEIKNKYPQMDITLNSREASKILSDLLIIFSVKEPLPETNQLIKYLKIISSN